MRYFTATGWVAIFSGTDSETGRTRPVEGWDLVDGTGLVVDPQRGGLRRVTEWPDFSHLEQAEKVVSALPGGGWHARWNEEGKAPTVEPVIAWLIHADGKATPITAAADGEINTAEFADSLLPPGSK
ncbi:hypothetical protein [Nonomuraea wenchangensis]|uniref:hypothetical protein n=1 Tax=Nonomuraea wenchangensis TaxID=568860 RepID=UPI003321BFDA